jgi:hypothetical protein
MEYMMILYFAVMLIMNLGLLRQLNSERVERQTMMDRYEKLAVAVRYHQLQAELPADVPLPEWSFNGEEEFIPRGRASVADVEGA